MKSSNKLETLWSNDYGRYFVAASDIPEKTLVLLENVLLHAPADDVKDRIAEKKLMCLVCCIEGVERLCSSCGWTICSTNCEKMQCHINECLLFTKNKVTHPPPHGWPILNKTILVLRCLLMKLHDPRVWTDFICKLEHHSDARSLKSACNKSDNMIVDNIQYFYSNCECPFTEKEIRFVCGVINVNAFSAENIDNCASSSWKTKCLFEEASLFAHSCSPNCSWNIKFNQNDAKRPDVQIAVVTAVPVKKGEMLTIFYSTRYALYGTLKRIVLMEEIAHFQCKCSRCRDRTELETFMSAVKCLDCENGYLLPEEPTDIQSHWKCFNSLCGNTQSASKIVCKVCEIEDYVERIKDLNLSVQEESKLLSTVARKYSDIIFHKNHYALQEISMRIVQLVVEGGYLNEEKIAEITLPNLDFFVTHCEYLLDIGQRILSAMTGYIGTLETYLQEAKRIRRMIGSDSSTLQIV